jgi:hypothetical protein
VIRAFNDFTPMYLRRGVIEAGDVLTCLVEISGREGYFAEVGPYFQSR